jgi:hemin uptake protein HemP
MATLFNTKISATYEGLFKTIDNAAITASLKELTDGSGNQSGLYVNTAGDFKVSNILEWGSLKDTGTGVTITRYVTSTDGIENFDNNTSLPTSAAVKLYVDSKFATSDTLQEVLSFGNTTGGNDIVVSASDDITFTDSSKILMGASSDLQIYHDGSNSFIRDLGTGNLLIDSNGAELKLRVNTTENALIANSNGSVELYYNNIKRFETQTDGSKVTGNLVVTGTITGVGGSFLPLAGGTMTGNTLHGDNVKSLYGTGSDLEIYHNGSHSYIDEVGTGSFYLRTNGGAIYLQDISGNPMAQFTDGGGSHLMYNGNLKLSTANTGVSITGALSTTTNVTVGANATFVDNGKALFGNSNELEIYHDSTNNIIKSSSGQLKLLSNAILLRNSADDETLLSAFANDTVILYNNNIEKFRTLGTGAKVTGNLEVTGTITGAGGSFLPLIGGTMTGDTIHNDNVKSIYGTGSDLEIYHSGFTFILKRFRNRRFKNFI